MDSCFAACGCDDNEGITKADLDRFTDKIENVLNDERGRKLFRNFMFTSKLQDGRKALNFYEHIDRLLNYKEGEASSSYRSYLNDLDKLIDEAERIEELDFAMMERLTEVRESERKEDIVPVLQLLKTATIKIMRREFTAFKHRFVPK